MCKPVKEPTFSQYLFNTHPLLRLASSKTTTEDRQIILASLVLTFIVGLFIVFVFHASNEYCIAQTQCLAACQADFPSNTTCIGSDDPLANEMSTYDYGKTDSDGYSHCHEIAIEWEKSNKVIPPTHPLQTDSHPSRQI